MFEWLEVPLRENGGGCCASRVFQNEEEVLVAGILTEMGIRWEYETLALTFTIADGKCKETKPDFFIPDEELFLEVKRCRANARQGVKIVSRYGYGYAVVGRYHYNFSLLRHKVLQALHYARIAREAARRRYPNWKAVAAGQVRIHNLNLLVRRKQIAAET